MSPEHLLARLRHYTAVGSLAGLRVVVAKPNTKERIRNVYYDLDQETPSSERLVLVQFYPQYLKEVSAGLEPKAQEVISHPRALRDIWNQIDRYGWELVFIGKDR